MTSLLRSTFLSDPTARLDFAPEVGGYWLTAGDRLPVGHAQDRERSRCRTCNRVDDPFRTVAATSCADMLVSLTDARVAPRGDAQQRCLLGNL